MAGVRIRLLMVVTLLAGGCASSPQDFRPIWKQASPPPSDLTAPAGFEITPAQAFAKVRETPWALSLKHPWHVYADSRYYYFHDVFLDGNLRAAYTQGIRVDGRTGEIVPR